MFTTDHRLVCAGPDDDQPWCARCARDIDHPLFAEPCPSLTRRTLDGSPDPEQVA